MYVDPIVEEIHQIREQHCQQFHFDLHQIFADVKQREQHAHHRVVNLSGKKQAAAEQSLTPGQRDAAQVRA